MELSLIKQEINKIEKNMNQEIHEIKQEIKQEIQEIKQEMKIVTWNVNGIRSRVFNDKTSAKLPKNKYYYPEEGSSMYNLINNYNPDIICLQETRCDEINGSFARIKGYSSYFNASRLTDARGPNRYSGTAIYSKISPNKIEFIVPEYIDREGRIIIAYYDNFILINVYSPNSGTNYDNKILFQNAIMNFIKQTLENNKNNKDNKNIKLISKIIYCGDFNVAIDTHFDKETVKPMPGIYKHELDYYDKLIEYGFKDSKSINDKIKFTWWDQRGKKIPNYETQVETSLLRYLNRGWRIDYVFTIGISSAESFVLKHIGEEYSPHASDHAPILCNLQL